MTISNDKKLLIYGIISLIIFLLGLFLYSLQYNHNSVPHQTSIQADTTSVQTYEYIITSINSKGITGKSTTDNTGIFLTHENVKGLSLSTNDLIKVSFPADDYETITHVQKVSNNSNLIKESFTITQLSNGNYQAVNVHMGTDKKQLFFTQSEIASGKSYQIGDKVTAYYKPLNGEDQFIKVE